MTADVSTGGDASPVRWLGRAKFLLIWLVAALTVATWPLGGGWALAVPAAVFGLIPALDALLGHDRDNGGAHGRALDVPLLLWVPAQLGLIALLVGTAPGAEPLALATRALAVGIVGGAGGITIAHELVHRTGRLERAAAEVLMASVHYTWFCVEHVFGHHRNVGTPDDPATSRLGEPLHHFLPRTLVGSLRSAVRIEGELVARRGIRPFSLADRRLRYALGLLGAHLAALALGGVWGWLAFLGQAGVAVLLLEVINYVEHYGLVRGRGPDGALERVRPEHSWNSSHALTGAFLFNLPRHADHHAHAARPYGELRVWDGAPELPVGYATAVLLALVPPLWFRVMDPRVAALRAR